ncbi:MAG: CarD family transcriptional regulator [Deltaproteobacteria bacterium]|jgi:CarD family transcriptional regulator|nr:CarD family transcriptional regulator [Deltaproteobacteria bacterium]
MAKPKFKTGNKVAYPGQGVAEIVGVNKKTLSNQTITFYELNMLETDIKIMVPIHKANEVGIRALVDEEEIKTLMEILNKEDVVFDKQTWNRRYRGFVEKIKTGSIFDVAEVYRDLSLLKFQKTLSFGEKRMLETSRSLIVNELSVVKDKEVEKVEEELEAIFTENDPEEKE